MANPKRELTFWEATSVVAGYGIGGGVMAVPYLTSLNNPAVAGLVLLAAFCVSVLLHLMIAEMSCRNKESTQLIELLGTYVFKGKAGLAALWVFFGAMTVTMLTNLAAYIAGAGEIIQSLTGLPLWLGESVFYVLAAGVVFFGLKVMGVCEKVAVAGIAGIMLALVIATLTVPLHPLPSAAPQANLAVALFGMVMFSFSAFFSVPQAAEGLGKDGKRVWKAVVTGIAINMGIILAVTLCSLAASDPVTEVAIIGWSKAIGDWANLAGSVFVLLAMVTSYWAISMALADILGERLKLQSRLAWLLATLPSFLIAVIGFTGFLGFMRLAGGGIAILVAVLVIPAYALSRKAAGPRDPEWNLGGLGATPVQLLVLLGYLAMAYGSVVTI
jgi:amino acid permease